MINRNLISGVHYDYAGNEYPIPQTMAGVDIDVDFKNGTERLLRSLHKQSQKPSTRSVRRLTNMSMVDIRRIARNGGTSIVLSV